MSLRFKVTLILCLITTAVFLVVMLISNTVFARSFQNIESQEAVLMALRGQNLLNARIAALDTLNHEWAAWDDTYYFLADPAAHADYVATNITADSLCNAGVNYIFLLDKAGNPVIAKAFDFQTRSETTIPDGLFQELNTGDLSHFSHASDALTGVLVLSGGSVILSARPVITGSGDGPIGGTIIMARVIDAEIVSSVTGILKLPVTINPAGGSTVPDGPDLLLHVLNSPDGNTYSQPISRDIITGYALIHDIHHRPALILRVVMPRNISTQGAVTTKIFTWLVAGLIFSFTMILDVIISNVVVKRVRRLAGFVEGIKSTGDFNGRLKASGRDEIGNLENNVNHMLDNLETSAYELKLKQREEETLRRTIESVTEGITTLDLEWNITDVNDRIMKLEGARSKADIIGRNIMEFVADNDRVHAAESMLLTANQGNNGIEQFSIMRMDGTSFHAEVSAAAIKNQEGEPVGYVISIKDITIRYKAIEDLKAERELIGRILSNLPNSILVIDTDEKVKLVNRSFCKSFGIASPSDVEGDNLSQVIDTLSLQRMAFEALAGMGDGGKLELRHVINGQDGIMAARVIPMQGEALIIIDDVTEEREKQERLYQADRLASVGEMAAGVAHELNNPLTSIIGLSQLLVNENVPADILEDLNGINSEAKRASAVVKNLLTFGRKHSPVKQSVQLNSVIEDVLKLRAYEQKVNNIQVNKRLSVDLPEVVADRFQMQQVFLNLVLNAEQAMVEAHKRGVLTVSTEQSGNRAIIRFTDDGPGIKPDNMPKLFTPFFTTKEIGKGTGLGLSICFGIITNHDGKIFAEAKPGQGASFVIELPCPSPEKGNNIMQTSVCN